MYLFDTRKKEENVFADDLASQSAFERRCAQAKQRGWMENSIKKAAGRSIQIFA